MSATDRAHFGMMAFVHETLYSLFRDPYKALMAAGLRAGQRVLEVGCGPGFFTVPAAEIVGPKGSVTSLGISPTAVKHVRQKVEEAGATNVDVILADASDPGLPAETFDLVFVFGLGHPVGDMSGIWVQLHRLLKPDGTLSVEGHLRPPSQFFSPLNGRGRIAQFRKPA
ncbi:MAG: class I SAM-dependent methyltransferase [Anaerolineae bacterium]|jgi:ubiquinone/menaquinone biosynthesis C-methylase UbiE